MHLAAFSSREVGNDLIVNAEEENFKMNNGRICCTVRGDLIRILSGSMRREGRRVFEIEPGFLTEGDCPRTGSNSSLSPAASDAVACASKFGCVLSQ
jgi:hypothetical protein